ncbi:hypothetical protein PGC34_12285 [Pseudomonas kribbensis]|uniref:hypothetical protein n=1 Tax=Pseudomonas kribbensis TaxID=1628086 RepID=UPI003BF88A97
MQVASDNRPEDFLRLEHLLYGWNYQVWVNVYGPLDANQSLVDALRASVSGNCEVDRTTPLSVEDAKELVIESLTYPGDEGAGPIDLELKRAEVLHLAGKLLEAAHVEQADQVSTFWLKKGHPGYPVFWEFALDVHAQGQRWILLGCSSD